jgi:hypothetical protein
MTDRTWKLAKWSGIGVVVAVVVAVPYLPGRTEPVTRESLESARARWEDAKIADYDFDLEVSGDQSGNYHVEVREGKVANMTLNGRATESNAPQYFTIDGLFQTLEEYLDHCENPATGVIPEGSTVWLRMQTDRELGYPTRFVRQVKLPAQRTTTGYQASSGAQGIEFRVTRLDRKAPPAR